MALLTQEELNALIAAHKAWPELEQKAGEVLRNFGTQRLVSILLAAEHVLSTYYANHFTPVHPPAPLPEVKPAEVLLSPEEQQRQIEAVRKELVSPPTTVVPQ